MANTNQNTKKFSVKNKGASIFAVAFSSILAAGTIAGSGVGIWQIAKNHTESAEFTKSVSGRVKIDPAALLADDQKQFQTEQQAEAIIADCAEKLSRWLKDRGQKSYDVSYEFYKEEKVKSEDQYFGYLNAQFEIEKVQKKHPTTKEEEEQKIDNDPYLSFFGLNGFNSNEKTLVYRWYNVDSPTGTDAPTYTIIPFRKLFTIPKSVGSQEDKAKVINDKDGQPGVVFKVEESQLNRIYQNLKAAKDYSEEKDTENKEIRKWNEPRIYIVNNLQGLYDEANYHIANWWQNKDKSSYKDIYDDTTYSTFADTYKTKNFRGDPRGSTDDSYKLASVKDHDDNSKNIQNADIFNYIDQATVGTNELNFTTKYVEKIVTMNDFTDIMPEKITDDYKNDVEGEDPKISYYWYKASSSDEAKSYLNNQITYGFNEGSIAGFDFSDISSKAEKGAEDVMARFTGHDFKSCEIAPSFTETIFGGSNVIGILSLGFLIFLVALLIVLACLYRTTGVMSWICLMFALSMTGLIGTIGSTAISMSLIFGLFIIAIVGFMAALTICGRMKRRLNSREDTQVIISKTFRKSLLPIVDISVITLVFGVCFTYIAPISLNPMGLVLIIGAFAVFLSIYLLNAIIHGLFFNNKIMVNKFSFFGKPTNIANEMLAQSNMAIPSTMDATKLELPFYSSMSKQKIDATNKRALIAIAVVGGLLIACIIAFSVIGYTSSTMFHSSHCIAILYDDELLTQPWFTGLNYTSYHHDNVSGWWYFYTDMNIASLQQVIQTMSSASGLVIGDKILIQTIFGSTNQDILNFALISVLAAAAASCVYGAIRYNWISFVPMLAGVFGLPLITLGISAMSQIKFDQFVVLAFVLIVVVNTIYCTNLLGNTAESWSRKDAYNKDEFKYIVNVALSNNWTYIWTTATAYLTFIVLLGLTGPTGTTLVSIIGLLIIGSIITLVLAPFTLSFLLYQFMKVRNFTLEKLVIKNKNKVVINYDDIDEQGIEGINKFTKKIPVAKPSEKPQGAQ